MKKHNTFLQKNRGAAVGICLLILAAASALLTVYLLKYGYIASGNDYWGHLYKSQYMYEQIKQGNYYPLYTSDWYNGIQPYRYWAPFPYYLMALLQMFTGGDLTLAYALFAGVSLFFGGAAFVLLGNAVKRLPAGTFVGLLWFFMPENFRVFFCEGNLPRMVTAILIPYFLYFLYLYLRKGKNSALIGILFTTGLITLSHAMIGAMTGIASFLFFCFYCFENRELKKGVRVIIVMLLSFAVIGIWLLPALSGGLVGMNSDSSAEVMASLMYSLRDSLDPTNRIDGIVDTFYYGISIVVVSVFGILLARKQKRAGYYLAILVLMLTTTAALPFLSKLPLNSLLWMMRFATIAYGFFLFSFMEWRSLKKPFVVLLCLILIADVVPSFSFERYYTQSKEATKEEIPLLKKMTDQRCSILDLSAFGSYPSFGLNQGKDGVAYTYGWAWQGATTAPNIVRLNEALEKENYRYIFDRSIELGDDTVMIRKDLLGAAGKTMTDLKKGAEASGYALVETTNKAYIFKKATPKCFGVKTDYKGMAIGTYASTLELYYPSFTTGDSTYLDDYSFEELSQYQCLFLSGFTYHDRTTAEHLVTLLSNYGVRIVIDGAHLQVDKKTNRQHFLSVTAQDISFEDHYPDLYYQGTKMTMLDFSKDNRIWNTAYLEGCEEVLGTFDYSDQKLTFLGTAKGLSNVYFLGLNIAYQSIDREDPSGFSLLSELFGIEQGELANRTLYELSVTYDKDKMVIKSPVDQINTTLACLDTFSSRQVFESHDQLLYVNKGTTVITYHYPYGMAGAALSILGACCFLLYYIWILKKEKKLHLQQEKGVEET